MSIAGTIARDSDRQKWRCWDQVWGGTPTTSVTTYRVILQWTQVWTGMLPVSIIRSDPQDDKAREKGKIREQTGRKTAVHVFSFDSHGNEHELPLVRWTLDFSRPMVSFCTIISKMIGLLYFTSTGCLERKSKATKSHRLQILRRVRCQRYHR
ncbi:hypothetical protein RRG08_053187 [Elysia crispata]|uniref:Uncharacterized protein n=1 Tax=Elysia crispata TaxID=231223 RepID=A0AAE1D310_9GAST|nr:hypothetical protein RRG08_053187 [Elysia crispata]